MSDIAPALLELAQACLECRSTEEFQSIVRGPCRRLLPHTSLIAAIGQVDLDHISIKLLIPVDYPVAALATLGEVLNLRDRSALAHWMQSREPLVLSVASAPDLLSQRERQEMVRHDFRRVGAHGVLDVNAQAGSYFSFANVPETWSTTMISERLRLIAPLLHEALSVIHRRSTPATDGAALTATEMEILRWIEAGRTNAEIARLRSRSPATVRNQLTGIFRKLGASNRTEAIRLTRQSHTK